MRSSPSERLPASPLGSDLSARDAPARAWARMLIGVVALLATAVLTPGLSHAQEAGAGDSAAALPPQAPLGPEARMLVDTILVMEDRESLVWGDWYVDPAVGAAVERAIERRGGLSGRTWLESATPIRDLALSSPSAGAQELTFIDKGVVLEFWNAGEVEYGYVFEGPLRRRVRGLAAAARGEGPAGLVRIALPLPPASDAASLAERERLGRLDVTYRGGRAGGIPRGSFSVYLYWVDPELGYRIAGVGY